MKVLPISLLILFTNWFLVAGALGADESEDSTENKIVEALTADPAVIEKTTQRGPVTATIRLQPAKPIIGDSVTLSLEVIAQEGVELLMPEFGQALDRFSIMDFVPRESIDQDGRTVATQRYTLQPPMSGQQIIPPLMIEFVDRRPGNRPAPEGEDAYELLSERLTFEVESLVPKGAAAELKPPLRELGPRAVATKPVWPWLLGLALLLIAASPFIWRAWQNWQIRSRRRSAYDIAHGRLMALMAQPNEHDAQSVSAFFVELSDIVRHYLEDRFQLHAPELTTEEFLDVAAASPDLSEDHKRFLRDFLSIADQVKFARHVPDPKAIDQALQAAENFVEQTKQDAPLLDGEWLDEGSQQESSSSVQDSKRMLGGASHG